MLDETTFSVFHDLGRDIFLRGLISSHAGNMSIRRGENIFITRRAAMLGRLSNRDIVKVEMEKDDARALSASSEFAVHKAIYRHTGALAVLHAHPPYATLLSMTRTVLVPVDMEGSYFFESIPVIGLEKGTGPDEAASVISRALKDYSVVLVRGHGSFARGDALEQAYMFTSSLEAAAFFIYHMDEVKGQGRKKARLQ